MRFSELLTPQQETQPLLIPQALLHEVASNQPLVELSETFLETVANWEYEVHEVHRPDIGVGGAYAFYGKPLNPEEAFVYAQEVTGGAATFANAGGFKRIFAIESGFTPEEYLATECTVVSDLVTRSLVQFDKKTPNLLLTGTSLPTVPDFHHKIAKYLGMTDMNRVPAAFVRACDSAGSAFFALLGGEYDQLLLQLHPELNSPESDPTIVTVATWEDGWRLQNQGGDGTSAQLFSTGASAISFYYHPTNPEKSSLVRVVGTQMEVEEGVECLRYNNTVQNWTQEQLSRVRLATFMKPTDNDMAVQMNPIHTALYFRDNVVVLLEKALEELSVWFNDLSKEQQVRLLKEGEELPNLISIVAMHHPSVTMGTAVKKAAAGVRGKKGLGYQDEQLPWLLENGNAPAVMMLAAFIEILKQNKWDTNKFLQLLSFGAGGTFTTQIVRTDLRVKTDF